MLSGGAGFLFDTTEANKEMQRFAYFWKLLAVVA
jgi:hypothetical protein